MISINHESRAAGLIAISHQPNLVLSLRRLHRHREIEDRVVEIVAGDHFEKVACELHFATAHEGGACFQSHGRLVTQFKWIIDAQLSAAQAGEGKLTFEIYLDASKEYRWRLKRADDKLLATAGQGFSAKADCRKSMDRSR